MRVLGAQPGAARRTAGGFGLGGHGLFAKQIGNPAVQSGGAIPLPSFTATSAWGLFNYNPAFVGNSLIQITGGTSQQNIGFSSSPPYGLTWDDVAFAGSPPYAIDTLYDQNSNTNDLTSAGAARPTLDATNKLVSFDGAATGMLAVNPLYGAGGSQTGTIYIDFAPSSLATGVILETGSGAASVDRRISIQMAGGVLIASIYDATPVVSLANTKIVTVGTSRIFACFQFDTTQATAANQTALYVNNSSSGVTSPVSNDCFGLSMAVGGGNGEVSVGARNNAASSFLNGNMWSIYCKSGVDDAAARLVQYNYNQYLKSLAP